MVVGVVAVVAGSDVAVVHHGDWNTVFSRLLAGEGRLGGDGGGRDGAGGRWCCGGGGGDGGDDNCRSSR